MDYTLQLFRNIIGIGAASGLVFLDDALYIIADNSSFLYHYDLNKNELEKIKLFESSQENLKKKEKLDFESITKKGNKLHIFGSGSTNKRELKFSYNIENHKVKSKKTSKLYKKLKQNQQFDSDDLNIEGAFYYANHQYLFQRGNGENAKNGVFMINENKDITFTKINLPTIKNIQATFTDAILVEDKIYFLAAVENTNSTYNDGEIYGCFIGRMSLNFEIEFVNQISEHQKFEGLTLHESGNSEISFLLCEDNDKEESNTNIFIMKMNVL
jgi:hypothetical protein